MPLWFSFTSRSVWYLVEPEVVRPQKPLKFGEKPVVVEVIDGLHVARTVVQITRDLHDSQNRALAPIYAHVHQHAEVCYATKQSNCGAVIRQDYTHCGDENLM